MADQGESGPVEIEGKNYPSTNQLCDEFDDPDEDVTKHAGTFSERRRDKSIHDFARRLSESSLFNFTIMLTILVNSTFDIVFLSIYSIEFTVKVYAEPIAYWKSVSNRFDFFILFVSYLQVFLYETQLEDWAEVLHTLQAARAIRAMRAVSFVRGLQVLLTALFDTMKKSFINVMLILLFLMYLFAIFGYYMFGYEGGDEENWGNLGVAFLTLFSFVTVDGWFEAQLEMDSKTTSLSRICTILFIIVGHFLIFNIFIGVNIMNIHEANENFHEQVIAEKEATVAQKKETILLSQQEDVRKLQEKQDENDYGNFYDMVKPFQDTLRNDDYAIMEDTVSDPTWLQLYLETLDHMDVTTFRIQSLHNEMANVLTQAMSKEITKRLGE